MKILIDQVRKNKNMSQIELATRSGVSERCIRNYSTGKVDPTLSILLKIANALGVSVSELFVE